MNINGIKTIIDNAESINASDIELSPNNFYNQKYVLTRIQSIIANKYMENYTTDSGYERYFDDKVKFPCRVAAANIDIDTSDIIVYNTNLKDRYRAVVLREMLREYMREKRFGILLNKTAEMLPQFGSVVWKKRDDTNEIELIPVYRLLFTPSVSNVYNSHKIQSSYIIEKHFLTVEELQAMTQKGWDKDAVNEIIGRLRRDFIAGQVTTGRTHTTVCVYELHCEIPDNWADTNDDAGFTEDGTWSKYRIYAVCDAQIGNYGLYCNKEKEFPYRKLDYHTMFNRALGLGIIEENFDNQARANENCNLIAESKRFGNKRVYTTSDRKLDGNTINDIEDNAIVYSENGLTKIDTTTPDTGILQYENSLIDSAVRTNSNSLESVTGEQPKTNTPYKSLIKENEVGSKQFLKIKQDFGLFIKEVIEDWVMPELINKYKNKKDKIIKILDERAIKDLQEMEINKKCNEVIGNAQLKGFTFSQEEINQAKAIVAQQTKPKELEVLITEDIFDMKYGIDINITNESRIDLLDQKNAMLVTLSQQMASGNGNEAIQQTEISLIKSMADDMGLTDLTII